MKSRCRFSTAQVWAGVCALLVTGAVGGEQSAPARLTFVKVFRGSMPEYVRIAVEESGNATYQGGAAGHPDEPESFRLSPPVVNRLFGLAAQLVYFQGVELESGLRVANLGQKTFLYERGEQRGEASFNHTRSVAAQELQQWFERIARGRFLARELEHRLVFDRLGLPETLREFEREYNSGQLVDPEAFVGVLERIASDPRLMQIAKNRAQSLLRRLRGGAALLQLEYGDQASGWYYKVTLADQGGATREARRFTEAANPQRLDLPEGVSRRLWELAQLANYFRAVGPSNDGSGRLRGYRFTYEAGAEQHVVVFATPPTAPLAEMVHLFQQLLAQEYFREQLRKALEEKSLQLQLVLQELDTAIKSDKLIAPRDFVPVLEMIAKANGHHPVVRGLAQELLGRIRSASP